MSRLAGAQDHAARLGGRRGDPLEHRAVDAGVAHHALAHLVPPRLELRLDHGQQAIGMGEHADDRREHECQGDERDVDDGEGGRGPWQVAGSQEARVDALQHGHAIVAPEALVDLAATDVERGHVRRPCLQEAIGEAARRGPDVEAIQPCRVDPERGQRGGELVAAARDVRRPLIDLERGALRNRGARLRDDAAVDAHAPGHHERLGTAAGLGEPALVEQLIESRHGVIVGHGCPVRPRRASGRLFRHVLRTGVVPRIGWPALHGAR